VIPQVKPPPPRSRVTLQGRFKRPFSFEDLLTGQASHAIVISPVQD
jgi:hypothetical protein